ncbi:MAG TPA: DnaJ domain-containing protein [Solirubrobacteraceae bacterium]|nr:DnaJ domain-containing protein [Solirubrobacteraceae bacterium]
MAGRSDPYQTLGVSPSASEVELRAAYRRLVQLHHPDHNHGSPESAGRFEEVQEAYAEVRRRRAAGDTAARSRPRPDPAARAAAAPGRADPDLEARLAKMERELRAARDAREHAVRQARETQEQALREVRGSPGSGTRRDRPSDEELGYVSTDDSFSKILDDAATELSDRWSEARRSPAAHRVSDLIDELAAKLTGEPPRKR